MIFTLLPFFLVPVICGDADPHYVSHLIKNNLI